MIWSESSLIHQRPSVPGSLLIDCTHDNETPNQKRTAEDALPNAALVAMASCAIGSTRGYDELVAHNIDVVKEHRLYRSAVNVKDHNSILPVKQLLNKLHHDMATQGFTEVHIHQGKQRTRKFEKLILTVENLIAVQRHNPKTHKAVYVLAHTSFYKNQSPLSHNASVVKIPGKIEEFLVAAKLHVGQQGPSTDKNEFIVGLSAQLTLAQDPKSKLKLPHLPKTPKRRFAYFFYLEFCDVIEISDATGQKMTQLNLKDFGPSSVLAFKASFFPSQQEAWDKLVHQLEDETLLTDAVDALSLIDLNELLYR